MTAGRWRCVTHTDFNLRRDIMREAIAIVGAEGDLLRNSYLPVALAKGAAADMALIDQQINVGWVDQHLNGPPPESAVHTHEFFREIMHDASAAGRVYGALETYSLETLMNAPEAGADRTPGDGIDDRTRAFWRIGSVQGVITSAEGNALQRSAEAIIEAQGARASSVNFLVGFTPYGVTNDLADVAGVSVGQLASSSDLEPIHEAEQAKQLRDREFKVNDAILLALAEHPDRIPDRPVGQMTEEERREFLEWANDSYDGVDHSLLLSGYMIATTEFLTG